MKEYGYATRYKECSPLETIHNVRNILYHLGILTKEEWKQDVKGYYSLNLSIVGTSLFSNGKGTSCEYALASAYGELIERLQNFVVFKYTKAMRKEALEYRDFYLAPDEKYVSIDEILHNSEKWLEVFTFEAEDINEKKSLLERWKMADYLSSDRPDFVALPYLNITENSINYIPAIMLISRYGSNGMCAGNTVEEALVQGISETIERYVNFKIISDGIVPPTIPESYIMEHCTHLYKMIKELESRGPFKLVIKDCSLGQGFPCIGIIFLDKKRGTYFVKFGAHPIFEIALERGMTELMQGRRMDDLDWMVKFSYLENTEISKFKNKDNIFCFGCGYYPARFFGEDCNYGFSEFEYCGNGSNGEMLSYLINIIQGKGYDILIRDVSFLEFPSFHVVVPFFSEVNDSNLHSINIITGRKSASSVLMHLEKACNEELQQVIDYMNLAEYSPYDSITKPLHRSFSMNFPWNKIKRDLFICSAYYKMRQFRKAYDAMDRFLKSSIVDLGERSLAYYSCIRDYIGARVEGIDQEDRIYGILNKMYPEDIVKMVFSGMRNPNDVFKNCGRLDCFECNKCPYTEYCTYPEMEKLYKKLKDRYAENVIDQRRIMNFCTCKKEVQV
ncbi:MAG: YcaO-like family protein [Firmicutes bacterium]|nr:YcaO-like family protein [Bacillota bacterium]